MKRRVLSMIMALAMLMNIGIVPVFAADDAAHEPDSGATIDMSGLCDHHQEHTGDCGYIEGEEDAVCTYQCPECAAQGDEPPADSACTCGAQEEGEAQHLPFCGAYVRPDAPSCTCVGENCPRDNGSPFCDVCYFDPAACAPLGGGPVAYSDSPLWVDGTQVSEDNPNGNDTLNTQSTEITVVELTVDIPKVGAGDNSVNFSVPEGAGYKVTIDGADGAGKWLDEGNNHASSFELNGVYHVYFWVIPEDNYTWDSGAQISITVNDKFELNTVPNNENKIYFVYSCKPESPDIIGEISLTDVPTTAAADDIAGSYSYTEPTGQYTVTGTWHRYNTDTGAYDEVSDGDRFENGKIYELRLKVDLAEGYWLDGECLIFVNGENIEEVYNNNGITAEVRIPPVSLASEVSMIEISADAIPKAVIGEEFQDLSIPVPVKEESSVTVSGHWIYRDEQGGELRSGTFESGKPYYFQLEAVPKAGYSLADDLSFLVGEEIVLPHEHSATMAKADIRVSFAQVIHEIELLDLPAASLGDTLQTGGFQVAVPEGAGYTAEAEWGYFVTDPVPSNPIRPVDSANGTNVVQNGGNYQLSVTITPANGYEFSESVQTKAYGIWHQQDHVDPEYPIVFTRTFSFRQLITDVEITAAAPEIGPVSSAAEPTVPSDAHYTISNVQWLDGDHYIPVSAFEAGHEYILQISIAAKEGYEFQRGTSVVSNGEKIEEINLPSPENPTVLVIIPMKISFKDTLNLEEIRLYNVPTMKVGESASTDITISVGDPYVTADVYWSVWNDEGETFEPFSGVFEDEKIYQLGIDVNVAPGNRINADNTRLFIDGVEYEAEDKGDWGFSYKKEFSSSLTPIERIELEIQAPVPGDHSGIKPVVTLPSGVHYRLSEDSMLWKKGNLDYSWDIDSEYFTEDGSYGVYVDLFAEEGYRFGENPIVLVNGTVLPVGAVEIGQSQSSIPFFFRYESAVEIDKDFTDSDIPQELKAAGFDTVFRINEHLKTAMRELNSNLENTVLYDLVLMYSGDGGATWHKADEEHFPSDGKLKVSLKVPEGTNHADHNFTVLHMFSSSAFGKTPGDWEQPEVTERTGADGIQYLDFYVTGLSPILVGWKSSGENGNGDDDPDGDDSQIMHPQKPDPPVEDSPDADHSENVNTGDDADMTGALTVLILSLCGVTAASALLAITKYRKKERCNRKHGDKP